MAELVSSRYALALFEAGLDLNKIDEFYKDLELLESVFEENKKLLNILNHPKITRDEKRNIIDEIFKDRVSLEIINFLYILIDKRREKNILEIIDYYKEEFYENKNIVKVVAITAVPMVEQSKSKLRTVLANKLNKEIELTNEIDSTILGGVMLKVENKLMDGTIKGQLEAMGKAISGATN